MSELTRRQVMRAAVTAGAALSAGTAVAGPEKEQPGPWFAMFLPEQMTAEEILAARDGKNSKIEFAGKYSKVEFADAVFWVKLVDFLGGGVPHAGIGIYAAEKDGMFRRCLVAESWAAGKIEASVDQQSGMLELRERANSALKGQLVLACNLRTIGTQHSIRDP